MKIEFEVPGEPRGKGRPRFSNRGGFVKTYTPKETAAYENLVRLTYREKCDHVAFEQGVAVDLRVIAYMQIPTSASKKKRAQMQSGEIRPTKRPDSDNILKAILDGLNGVAYHDDAQIVDMQIRRFYSDNPRLVVIIQSIERETKNE